MFSISANSTNIKCLVFCVCSWKMVVFARQIWIKSWENVFWFHMWKPDNSSMIMHIWKPTEFGSMLSGFFLLLIFWGCLVFVRVQLTARFAGADSWPTLASYYLHILADFLFKYKWTIEKYTISFLSCLCFP